MKKLLLILLMVACYYVIGAAVVGLINMEPVPDLPSFEDTWVPFEKR